MNDQYRLAYIQSIECLFGNKILELNKYSSVNCTLLYIFHHSCKNDNILLINIAFHYRGLLNLDITHLQNLTKKRWPNIVAQCQEEEAMSHICELSHQY
ncbi:Proteasome subunit [Dirofilaria immitis]